MPAAPVLRMELQRESADCAIAALAMYLGVTYEDVLRVVAVTDRAQGRTGLWTRTLQRIAAVMGHRLLVRRTFDWEESYGIVRFHNHAAVLRNGLVINGDGTIWDADAFLSAGKYRAHECVLLVAQDENG
jgi:hypothetical protein